MVAPLTLQSISLTNTQPVVVLQPFYVKLNQVSQLIDKQIISNCYNACLETIVIKKPTCDFTTTPAVTVVQTSALTVTGTCVYT